MKKHISVILIIIFTLLDSSLASKFQNTAYFQALDQAFHTPGTPKIFIVRPKKCSRKCQQTIQGTQHIIRDMNLLRNVPFIVADAFATNENLQIRSYDENGKLSGKLISDASQQFSQQKIRKFLEQKLFKNEPKTKVQNKEGFPVQNIAQASNLIDKYTNQLKKNLSDKREQFFNMNQRVFEPESESLLQTNDQTKQEKPVITNQNLQTQPSITQQQIKNMIEQQMQNGINKDQVLSLIKNQINKDTTLKTQIEQIKQKFTNLKQQLQEREEQRNQEFQNQKRTLQKESSQNSRQQKQQRLTKVISHQNKNWDQNNDGLYFKACLIIIGILAIYIFVTNRKNERKQQFQRLPSGQTSFQRI